MKNLKKILSVILCMMLTVSCLTLTSCDLVDQLTGLLGGTTQGGGVTPGGTADDWFDSDIFDDEETGGSFNDDETGSGSGSGSTDDVEEMEMNGPGAIKFEAEYAVWDASGAQFEFGLEYPSHASNGMCVSTFRTGGKLIFKITSDKAETGVTVTISAASCVEIVENGATVGVKDVTAEHLVGALTCNGTVATITGQFDGSSPVNWYNFTTITATIDLVEGENEIVFTCTADHGDNVYTGLNVDYIQLTTTEAKLGWYPEY